eukprot:294659_1
MVMELHLDHIHWYENSRRKAKSNNALRFVILHKSYHSSSMCHSAPQPHPHDLFLLLSTTLINTASSYIHDETKPRRSSPNISLMAIEHGLIDIIQRHTTYNITFKPCSNWSNQNRVP